MQKKEEEIQNDATGLYMDEQISLKRYDISIKLQRYSQLVKFFFFFMYNIFFFFFPLNSECRQPSKRIAVLRSTALLVVLTYLLIMACTQSLIGSKLTVRQAHPQSLRRQSHRPFTTVAGADRRRAACKAEGSSISQILSASAAAALLLVSLLSVKSLPKPMDGSTEHR